MRMKGGFALLADGLARPEELDEFLLSLTYALRALQGTLKHLVILRPAAAVQSAGLAGGSEGRDSTGDLTFCNAA